MLTTKVTLTECVKLPLVPVMVTVKVPALALQVLVRFSVDVPEPVTEAGLKFAVIPAGSPLMLRATAPVNPPDDVAVRV